MNRIHIHVSIEDLSKSIAFYSSLFGCAPVKQKPDYAKWMLDDPPVNFAISTGGRETGVDHLGFQMEDDKELEVMRERLKNADMQTFAEGETVCCYAKSDKTWVEDPDGIAWETYRTMADAETFKDSGEGICCAPISPEEETTACC